jgi:glycosyltransferase involved in cell wall biosynthesis
VHDLSKLRIAIVHYWFMSRRGGERVVGTLAEMFPQADFYTLLANPEGLPESLAGRSVKTSFVQKLPGSRRWHRQFLPLYPLALEQFDLRSYDLVISSDSGPAKGVLTPASTCHVCYCHSPMRYLWDLYPEYRDKSGHGSRFAFSLMAHYLRMWDVATASRVDYFVANSYNVSSRIRKHYRRAAPVIYPPVDVSAGSISEKREDYYLFVGELVNYKRADLAIEACNRLSRKLHVVGSGPEYKRLRRMRGPNVEFFGHLSDRDLRQQYAHCRALIFPSEDDLGIVPIEAQSFGRPVIAFGRGGVLESVLGYFPGEAASIEASTGVFFAEQSAKALEEAILAFERDEPRFSPTFIRAQVEHFDVPRFKSQMEAFLIEKVNEFNLSQRQTRDIHSGETVGT